MAVTASPAPASCRVAKSPCAASAATALGSRSATSARIAADATPGSRESSSATAGQPLREATPPGELERPQLGSVFFGAERGRTAWSCPLSQRLLGHRPRPASSTAWATASPPRGRLALLPSRQRPLDNHVLAWLESVPTFFPVRGRLHAEHQVFAPPSTSRPCPHRPRSVAASTATAAGTPTRRPYRAFPRRERRRRGQRPRADGEPSSRTVGAVGPLQRIATPVRRTTSGLPAPVRLRRTHPRASPAPAVDEDCFSRHPPAPRPGHARRCSAAADRIP